jgi:hypothetical protein
MLKSEFFSIEKVNVIKENEPPLTVPPLTATLSEIESGK